MSKREFGLFLLIIVLIVIPIKNGYGWNIEYQMNKGTEIPFESSLHTGNPRITTRLIENQYWLDRLINFTSFGDPLDPMPEFDLENYFYYLVYIGYLYGDRTELLSLNYDEGYHIHIKLDRRDAGSSDGDQYILLTISNSYYEEDLYLSNIKFYIVDYDFEFYFYIVLDLLIITRIIYLKSKKRPILGSFLQPVSLDNLTRDTLEDLERKEELRDAMDPEN